MKVVVFCLLLVFVFGFGNVTAKEKTNSELNALVTARSEFKVRLKQSIETTPNISLFTQGETAGGKSVKKSVLFSAIVPGAGQIYANSYIKGFLFLGVEIAAIALNLNYDKKANDFEDEFEGVANAQWDENSYWDWIAQISSLDRSNKSALRDYERRTFSHFLPNIINQQYYENVGKYNQFIYGWNDFRDQLGSRIFTLEDYLNKAFDSESLDTISPTRVGYVQIRKESNDNFKKATTMTTIIMFNHILSAIDAGLTTKFHNRKFTAELNMQGKLYNEELVPVLALGVLW